MFDIWKKGFDKWESITADYVEKMLRSPAVLFPSGKMLEGAMKTKAKVDEASTKWWGAWGLPTKHDQERALHRINKLEGQLLDMEELIRELKDQNARLRDESLEE